MAKVNSDIVGKVVNLASRTASFITKRFDGKLSASPFNAEILEKAASIKEDVIKAYSSRNYAEAIRIIMGLADEANRYIDAKAPWVLAKEEGKEAELQAVCSDGINLFKALITYLQPVLPNVAKDASEFLNDNLEFDKACVPLCNHQINKFKQF